MKKTESNGWNPYLAGALSGLLIIMAAWIGGNYFGASSCFVRAAGFLESIFYPQKVAAMEYFMLFKPEIDWQMMFVAGILLGSLISSVSSGSFRIKAVPDMWKSRFGSGSFKRNTAAFIGGVILMFGARLAGGCPSGYGLGALAQLAS